MKTYDVVVIGGGAAGIMAAIYAKRQGASVLICEKSSKIGRKLLVTGAGRCNLLNDTLDASFYNPNAERFVKMVFEKFGKKEMLDFFREIGLAVYTDGSGRIFPVTNQASSVLKVLEMELSSLKVPVELNCAINDIEVNSAGFSLKAGEEQEYVCQTAILCGGGKSYPALGSDGNGYALARKFRHTVLDPVPSTVPLLVKDPWCHSLQGQKIQASVTSRIQNKNVRTLSGELLFTQYGLSGTAVLDISEEISVAVNRHHIQDISIIADVVPFMSEKELSGELSHRLKKEIFQGDLLEGLLPHKFSLLLKEALQKADVLELVKLLKHKEFKVFGTRGWNEAEFTAGGIPLDEVAPETLESRLQRGFFIAGEILDVQGRRGGYNLAWAWASGAVAGAAAHPRF